MAGRWSIARCWGRGSGRAGGVFIFAGALRPDRASSRPVGSSSVAPFATSHAQARFPSQSESEVESNRACHSRDHGFSVVSWVEGLSSPMRACRRVAKIRKAWAGVGFNGRVHCSISRLWKR